MTDKETQAAAAALFEALAVRLTKQTRFMLLASDVRAALLDALAERLPEGGCVMLWYDRENGLRVNVCQWGER